MSGTVSEGRGKTQRRNYKLAAAGSKLTQRAEISSFFRRMSYSRVIASEDRDCLMLKGTDIPDLASKACQENSRNRGMLNMRSALTTI